MRDESYGFENTRARLEEIVTQVRKKDVSLEKSLDLLEEGVRLANQCTDLIDKADWSDMSTSGGEAEQADGDTADETAQSSSESGDGPAEAEPAGSDTGEAQVDESPDARDED